MPKGVPRTQCNSCARPIEECGPLSTRGKCGDCGPRRMIENSRQLHAHSGPFFDHWRVRCLAAFGIVAVDGRSEER